MSVIFGWLKRKITSTIETSNSIDSKAYIHASSYVSGSNLSGYINLDEGSKIYKANIEGHVSIGRYTSLWGPGIFVVGRKNGIVIGSFCSIARYVSIQEDNHEPQRTTTYFVEKNLFDESSSLTAMYSRGSIEIGNDVWIGAGAQIHSGVKIGHGAIIAGAAVVTRDVPAYAIVAGNPAHIVRFRFNQNTIGQLLSDAWWDWPLERLKAEKAYLLELHERPD